MSESRLKPHLTGDDGRVSDAASDHRLGAFLARPASLKPTSTGIYYRQVGYTETRSLPRFDLGTDKVEAGLRSARLEQLWRLVCDRHESIHGIKPHTRQFWDQEQTKPPQPYRV